MITLINMTEYTLQEVFDVVATHLLTQNKKSQDSHGQCLYKGPNGLHCAVGVLIPDELYCSYIEGGGISEAISYALSAGIVSPNREYRPYIKLLHDLQSIHDEYSHETWATELQRTAADNGFTCPTLPPT